MGGFFAGHRMEDDLRWREALEKRVDQKFPLTQDVEDDSVEFQEKQDDDIYFVPERGNVIFASAIDRWGFRVGKFAQLYASRMGVDERKLRKVIWGDFYLDPKTKKIKHLRGRPLKPLFVQLVLENIWAVYDAVVVNPCVISGQAEALISEVVIQECRQGHQNYRSAEFGPLFS